MPRWAAALHDSLIPLSRLAPRPLQLRTRLASFSTLRPSYERVDVPCGSSGSVAIDLFNAREVDQQSPLFIHLPPFSPGVAPPAEPPAFFRHGTVASINYRWRPPRTLDAEDDASGAARWPTPVHDVAFAYAWILENLAPPGRARRHAYIYGSYLGASLAMSLALTESRSSARLNLQGVAAYNGIYNWTMFLPDHRVNRPKRKAKSTIVPPRPAEGSQLGGLQEQLRGLFGTPDNLFDPFASPSLFFHGPGVLVPGSFTMSSAEAAAIDGLASGSDDAALPKQPRKSHLVFPPRRTPLQLPPTLLLYDSPHPNAARRREEKKRGLAPSGNTFEGQAQELAELMRRSVERTELKEGSPSSEEETERRTGVAERMVQVALADEERESLELGVNGRQAVQEWLDYRMGGS